MYIILLLIFALAFAVLWGIMVYNQLIAKKGLVRENQGMLDTQLKRLIDLIPNLIKVFKEHAAHELTLLEELTVIKMEYEEAPDITARIKMLDKINLTFSRVFAAANQYPALKQSPIFIELEKNYLETSEKVKELHESYNKAAKEYNNMIDTRSGSIISNLLNFNVAPLIALEK